MFKWQGKANNHSLAKFLLGLFQHPDVFGSLAKAKTPTQFLPCTMAGEVTKVGTTGS